MSIWIVHTPAIPGAPLHCTSEKAALREVRNATKAGLGEGAWINRVTLTSAA